MCARKLGAWQNCACATERKRLRLGPGWWDGAGAGVDLAITTARFPVIPRGECVWAVAAPGASRPCYPVRSWERRYAAGNFSSSALSERGPLPRPACSSGAGGCLASPAPPPLSVVYFGSMLLRFSPESRGLSELDQGLRSPFKSKRKARGRKGPLRQELSRWVPGTSRASEEP